MIVIGCEGVNKFNELKLNSIRVPSLNMTQSGFDQCSNECGQCLTDSEISWLSLPLPQSFCDDLLMKTDFSELKESGSLLLDHEGVNGNNITLSLPLLWLVEQGALGYVRCSGLSGNFVLGVSHLSVLLSCLQHGGQYSHLRRPTAI